VQLKRCEEDSSMYYRSARLDQDSVESRKRSTKEAEEVVAVKLNQKRFVDEGSMFDLEAPNRDQDAGTPIRIQAHLSQSAMKAHLFDEVCQPRNEETSEREAYLSDPSLFFSHRFVVDRLVPSCHGT